MQDVEFSQGLCVYVDCIVRSSVAHS